MPAIKKCSIIEPNAVVHKGQPGIQLSYSQCECSFHRHVHAHTAPTRTPRVVPPSQGSSWASGASVSSTRYYDDQTVSTELRHSRYVHPYTFVLPCPPRFFHSHVFSAPFPLTTLSPRRDVLATLHTQMPGQRLGRVNLLTRKCRRRQFILNSLRLCISRKELSLTLTC